MANEFQNKLVYIQDTLLETIARQDSFLREFPFLKAISRGSGRRKGCGHCGGGQAARLTQNTYAIVKATIAGLSSDSKRRLKTMLNAKHVRVVYRASSGKGIELTF